MKGATLLYTEMSPDMDWEDDFNEWYDGHRIPQRMAVKGFRSVQRYKDPDRSNYLAVYEVESPAVLESEEYLKLNSQPNAKTRWMLDNVTSYARYLGNEISDQRRDGVVDDALDAAMLYAVFFSVPDEKVDEFNDWYTGEHVPILLKCADWLIVRRFEIYDGEPQPWTHLALHYLASASALDSPELEEARSTEWRSRLAEEPWFRASYQIFERHGDRILAEG